MRTARSLAFAILLVWPCLLAGPLQGEEPEPGVTHALLLNGGAKPTSNYLSHLNHLQEMVELLIARGIPRDRIHIFSADGEDQAADLAVRDTLPAGFWLVEGTRVGKKLRPRTQITDTRWPEVKMRPARKQALEKWFKGAELLPGDRLLVFVTDHGTFNQDDADNGAISLWREDLTVQELKELLSHLRPGVQTVMVMSQCYSGSFAASMYEESGSEPGGEICGFFSTTRERKAYGCYPEGRDRDRIGHAFRFIEALDRHPSTREAHLEVLITDTTPDVPLRTSDVYLERLIEKEAKVRGADVEVLVDSLLSEAWRDRGAWESEIRLLDRIGDAFGTFSPRSLAELGTYERDLEPLIESMKDYARRWKAAITSVKEENLQSFLRTRSQWRERLEDKALEGLDADEREVVLGELLPQLEWHARDRERLWGRLQRLKDRASRASEAGWRLEVRKAAMLRMRTILVGIAARVLLAPDENLVENTPRRAAQHGALEELLSCEAVEPGVLPAPSLARTPLVEPFPPLARELQLLEEVLPSWLGVRFRPVPASVRAERGLSGGATQIQSVYPDSPAWEAGLEIGDIVLGPPETPFDTPGQLREWTMLSPRQTPLELRAIRPAVRAEEDRELEVVLFLRSLPLEWPELPGPPKVGDLAPPLPSGLAPVGHDELSPFAGRPHILFFWATWCLPCKNAVPEVMAYAAAEGIPVLAISDEEPTKVAEHLDSRSSGFFDQVAVDPLRKSFMSWGVSGTPTIIVVDDKGIVRHRQVGYNQSDGLSVEAWSWSGS